MEFVIVKDVDGNEYRLPVVGINGDEIEVEVFLAYNETEFVIGDSQTEVATGRGTLCDCCVEFMDNMVFHRNHVKFVN